MEETKYTFKVETDDLAELHDYTNALRNSAIIFELRHNFHRQFETISKDNMGDNDESSFYAGVNLVLDKLKEYILDEMSED